MQSIITGLFLILALIIGYYLSWRQYQKGQITRALCLIIALGFLVRLFVSCDFYLHEWDERYHALVAKNLIDNPLKPLLYAHPILPYDYTQWASNHVWLHKQPFALWMMALSLKIFGIHELALRLPSILVSTCSICLTFQIAKRLFNQKIALIAAFLHSINGLLIELVGGRAATDHIDVFFCFLVELSVYLG